MRGRAMAAADSTQSACLRFVGLRIWRNRQMTDTRETTTDDLRELFDQLSPVQQEHITETVRELVQCEENEKLNRYVAALRRTPRNEWGLQTIPDELAGEFYEDSID